MKTKYSEEKIVQILNEVVAGASFWKPAGDTASAKRPATTGKPGMPVWVSAILSA